MSATKQRKLVEVTKESVDLALKEVKPWGRLGDIGAVISEYVHQHGYTVLRDIGGHGVGNDFHEDPYVCHIGKERNRDASCARHGLYD